MLHKKYNESHVSVKEFSENTIDFTGLRDGLDEMKNAIFKLSLEEKEAQESNRKNVKKNNEDDFKFIL